MRAGADTLKPFYGPTRGFSFAKEIQPILKKHCYECHSEQADKRKAGYVFDDLHMLANDIGPNGIVVPREPAEKALGASRADAVEIEGHYA